MAAPQEPITNPLNPKSPDEHKDPGARGSEYSGASLDEGEEGADFFLGADSEAGIFQYTGEEGEVELGAYALPKKPRSLNNNALYKYTKLPAPPSRTDYSAHGHMSSKTLGSRIGYTIALLNMVIWWPLWLKAIQVQRFEPLIHYSIWDPNITLDLVSPLLTDPTGTEDQCELCSSTGDVTWPVTIKINDFRYTKGRASTGYVQLFASWDYEDWYTVSHPGVLTGLPLGDSQIQACETKQAKNCGQAKRDGTLQENKDECLQPTYAPTPYPIPAPTPSPITAEGKDGTWSPTLSPAPTFNWTRDYYTLGEGDDDEKLSSCCMGAPGTVYLVACLRPSYPRGDPKKGDFFHKLRPPPFDNRCIAMDSLCGSSCGVSTTPPVHCKADPKTGKLKIPSEDIISVEALARHKTVRNHIGDYLDDEVLRNATKNFEEDDHTKWFEKGGKQGDWGEFYRNIFITLVLMSGCSVWVSFLPGIGNDLDPPCPSMQEVEEHMQYKMKLAEHDPAMGPDPLVLVSFSVSAGEPRMMVLRNFCGKMMAWVKRRKFVFDMPPSFENNLVEKGRRSVANAADAKMRAESGSSAGNAGVEMSGGSQKRSSARPSMSGEGRMTLDLRQSYNMGGGRQTMDLRKSYNTGGGGIRPSTTLQKTHAQHRTHNEQSGGGEDGEEYDEEFYDDNDGGAAQFDSVVDEMVELIDIFQDEGHRVGAYALWDSFLDVINDADLRFVENLANKMQNMEAKDGLLPTKKVKAAAPAAKGPEPSLLQKWGILPMAGAAGGGGEKKKEEKKEKPVFDESEEYSMDPACVFDSPPKPDDPNVLCDDELRGFILKGDMGIDRLGVRRLELAWTCYDLLIALGHPYFWRTNTDKSGMVSFYEFAGNSAAEKVLRRWAINWKKKKGDPFAQGVVPVEDPAIKPSVWRQWWKLYAEQGQIKWTRGFDFTQFRAVKVKYYAEDDDDNKTTRNTTREAQAGTRAVVMCYSARADPEAAKGKSRMVRGLVKNTWARLLETYDPNYTMAKDESRRCHARVIGHDYRITKHGRKKCCRLTECTPEMLQSILRKAEDAPPEEPCIDLTAGGWMNVDAEYEREGMFAEFTRREPAEAVIDNDLLTPLRQCRGKSGGMNHAVDILDAYLVRHSNLVQMLIWFQHNHVFSKTPRMFFAIFDCRHMGTQGFWEAVIPNFYRYKSHTNPWQREIEINPKVSFVQLPQTFAGLGREEDFFDMRNEYGFRMANTVRNGVGAVTSCGTNAVWNYEIKMQKESDAHDAREVHEGRKFSWQIEVPADERPKYNWLDVPLGELSAIPIRFNEETMIEDTASSHDAIISGKKGVYLFERLVIGARKGTSDYLAAVYRWSKGGVQLFWTSYWPLCHYYTWPWKVLTGYVLPLVICTSMVQAIDMEKPCYKQIPGIRASWCPDNEKMPVWMIVANPVYICFVLYTVTLVSAGFFYRPIGAYVVMFETTTYFFNSLAAFFWVGVPIFLCFSGEIPFSFDAATLTLGGLWVEIHLWIILLYVKDWAPTEKGQKPAEHSILRAQQMYFVTAPLHMLALIGGNVSGFSVVFLGEDASRWSSFDNVVPLIFAKLWIISMNFFLVTAILKAIIQMIVEKEANTALLIGAISCSILFMLVSEPSQAMFFYESLKKKKLKHNGWMHKFTTAIYGSSRIITLKHVYVIMWTVLLYVALRARMTGVFTGNNWYGFPVEGDGFGDDPTDDDDDDE